MEKKNTQTLSANSILVAHIKNLPDDEILTMFNLSKTCLLLQLDKYDQMEQLSRSQFNEIKKALIESDNKKNTKTPKQH